MPFDMTPRTPCLDRADFERWLTYKGDQIVGYPNAAMECPLATYLNETYGGRWRILWRAVDTRSKTGFWRPCWAIKFVNHIDSHFYKKSRRKFWTGTEALAILQEIH